MPTSSSDSEGTSERPRRRPSTRAASSTPARRPSTRTRRAASDDAEAPAPAATDDDFGSGVENEVRPARVPREKRAVAPEPEVAAEPASEPRAPRAPRGERPARRAPRTPKAAVESVEPPADEERLERGERTSSTFMTWARGTTSRLCCRKRAFAP